MAPASKYRQNITLKVYSNTSSIGLYHCNVWNYVSSSNKELNISSLARTHQIFRVQERHQDGQVDDGTRQLWAEERQKAKPLEGGDGPAQLPDEGDD